MGRPVGPSTERSVYLVAGAPIAGASRPERGLHSAGISTTVDVMTPLEAAAMAAELLTRMDRLSVLDLHPVENAAELDTMRADAEEVARDLLGYLLTSANFAPVVEADDAVQEWELA